MGLRDYLEILWRRRLVVLLPVLAAAALAAAPALMQPPAYRSTTTLFFAPRDPSDGTALAGQRLASYVALVGGPRLAQGVAQQLGLPQDEASLKDIGSRLTATVHPESLLVTVAATSAGPQDAQRLAQTAASQLVQLAASLEPPSAATQTSPIWLTIAEPAEPGLPLGRGALVQDVVLALVLGLAAGSALAFLADALDPRVTDARNLRRIVPGAVLPLAVPRAQPGSAGSAVQEPAPPAGAVRVLRTALLGRALPDAAAGAGVLVVTGAAATGSTRSVADWIGTALGRSGRSVLVVRATEQDAAPADGPGDAPALAQALAGRADLDNLPLQTLDGGLQVLPLGGDAGDPGELLAAPGVADLVRQLATRFDHVVIEAPPVLPYVETALLAAQCADQVVLVVTPGWARRRQVRSAVAVLAQQGAPVTLTVLVRALRRGTGRAVRAEVLSAPLPEVAAPDVAPPVAAPLPSDPALEADLVSGDEVAADEAAADGEAAGRAPSDADTEQAVETVAETVAEPDAEADALVDDDTDADAEPDAVVDGDAEAEPDADSEAQLDGELDKDLDKELEDELDADRPVLSGGGPTRGGDA